MKIMERAKQLSTTAVLAIVTIVILINASVTYSIPLQRSLRSVGDQMFMSDAMLRDFMMYSSDLDHDGKLSESEITWFYRMVAQYDGYVAELYGSGFIEIADYDNDGLLSPEELLRMLLALDAHHWTKKR